LITRIIFGDECRSLSSIKNQQLHKLYNLYQSIPLLRHVSVYSPASGF
jgi:hypothetical protein